MPGSGSSGFQDGKGTAAKFRKIYSLEVDTGGNIVFGDPDNNRIRMMHKDGTVITLAGTGQEGVRPLGYVVTTIAGYPGTGFKDGIGAGASFSWPSGLLLDTLGFFEPAAIAVDKEGNLYIADQANFRIRKIAYE